MIQPSYSRLLAIICFVLSIGVLSSCDKDDSVANDGKAALYSFGPTGSRPGDTLKFIGVNLDKVSSIQFTGINAVVDKKDFKTQSSDLIQLLVPPTTEKGYVTLKAYTGDITTKTILNLNVTSAFSITSFTNPARPGSNITINGNYLNWVDRITFEKGKLVTTFVSKSQTQIVVKVPDDAQTGPLIVHYTGTDSADVETKDTLKVTLPLATSFTPAAVKHQTNVTINGTNLDLAKKVMFTGDPSVITTFVSQSATQLVVKVPAGTTKGKVTLEAASGVQSVSAVDLDVVLPSATSLTPNPINPGDNLTITGTNLDVVKSVNFENAPPVTSFVSQSATQIVVKSPLGILKGKLTFAILNSTVTVQSNDVLDVVGSIPPPVMSLPIYNDALTSNWNGWLGGGWGGTSNLNNTTPVREGTKSIKIDYSGGYGSPFQIGGASISLASYTSLKISIFGAPGSGGKTVTIAANGTNNKYNITIVEGAWTDYSIPLSTLTATGTLNEIWVQEFSGTGGFTIYVDALGLN